MKKLFLACSLSFSFLEGALPPLYQDIREIEAVLKQSTLGSFLDSGESILSIQKKEHGYLISGSKHEVFATITYLPNTLMGPANFDVTLTPHTP